MNAYLNYLKESLGLENFIVPEGAPVAAKATEPTPLLGFFIPSNEDKQLSREAFELLNKMVQAMGLTMEQILLVVKPPEEWAYAIEPGKLKVRVTFTSDEKAKDVGVWTDHNGVKSISTFSPELLVLKPEFKKPTWTHLQSVMSALK